MHGVVVADSTSVVALRTETGTSRVEGPYLDENGRPHSGVIFTVPEEEIDAVIDLRPQLRRTPTTAQTRDGITVDVAVIAFFAPRYTRARKLKELYQLAHPSGTSATAKPPRPVHYPPPFAWRRASMIQALNSRRIERAGERTKKTEWGDRIMEIAIPRLRDLISEYTVDELTAWSTTDKFPKHPRYVIRDQLREIVTRELDADDEMRHPTGIDLRFMGVSPPMPPDEVIQRRIQAWTEEWRKKEADVFAQADAEAMLTRELARAQVQGEMTARINDILQEARAADTPSGDLVMLRFLEAMDKMAGNPMTRALLAVRLDEDVEAAARIVGARSIGASMSTASDHASEKQAHGTLRDWAVQNPNQIGLLRLMLFAAGLVVVGLLGARWAIPASPGVYSPTANCSYAAEWFEPPATAPLAVVSQTFQVNWKIQNTGSCHVWGEDVLFVRRNDAIASQAAGLPGALGADLLGQR